MSITALSSLLFLNFSFAQPFDSFVLIRSGLTSFTIRHIATCAYSAASCVGEQAVVTSPWVRLKHQFFTQLVLVSQLK